MENVGALTFRGLDRVLGSLAEIGYDAEWQDIRASDLAAPHKRERIWIVAYPRSLRRRRREHE
jgi:DNA (cytosine-5)-methyltransferase 1